MIPSILARQLQKGLEEYIRTTFPISSPLFRETIDRFLMENNLFKGPYISIKMPFREGSAENRWFEAVSLPFPPYLHQQRAFERMSQQRPLSTLIATGTGSGKTESFLYPILEACWRERGKPGIKAIILYPMNALASDQAARIARLVDGTPALKGNITAGMYVGERDPQASKGMAPDRLITDREIMRRHPPDLLLTNYKMLDYLLIRPADHGLWAQNGAQTLKFIVVDEFHTFDGAQGTDLACLLRRLKKRLAIPAGHLCCVGTSATMGGQTDGSHMRQFASQVFAEPFEEDALITEDRLSAQEYLEPFPITREKLPTTEEVDQLQRWAHAGMEREFFTNAERAWLGEDSQISLSDRLRGHLGFQQVIRSLDGQMRSLQEVLEVWGEIDSGLDRYNPLQKQGLVESLLALVSVARSRDKDSGSVSGFLDLHVQLWFREMRRMVVQVSGKQPLLRFSDDLKEKESKNHLPMINCRDCGATGWVSVVGEDSGVAIHDLREFYQRFFSGSPRVVHIFPSGMSPTEMEADALDPRSGFFCPDCMKLGEKPICGGCGGDNPMAVQVFYLNQDNKGSGANAVCPFCESKGGLVLVGAQNSTLISAGISEIMASRFNDDKKLLAFSDSVQDASHRAGFFNARTWRFNLRTAIQQWLRHGGEGQNLSAFVKGLEAFWRDRLGAEDYIATFIAPNLIWMRGFEHLKEKGRLPSQPQEVKRLLDWVGRRLKLETVYEYGYRCRVGRTLEKSSASILAVPRAQWTEPLERIAQRIHNETEGMRHLQPRMIEQLALAFVTRLKNVGGVYDPELRFFLERDGHSYHLSTDATKWMPGLPKSGIVPRFLEKTQRPAGQGNFETLSSRSRTFKHACKLLGESLNAEAILHVLNIFLEEMEGASILVRIENRSGNRHFYGLSPESMQVFPEVAQANCHRCGHWLSVWASDKEAWEGMPCLHPGCGGRYGITNRGENFFGRLYETGDLCRIVAAEHTGLIDRAQREAVERSFKRDKNLRARWDVNLLSCTPTLELGIDIGDLSSIILCQVPPARAQFMQRIGRPGRRDGNAFSTVAVNLKPHDQYFYEEPQEMISGPLQPPAIFLNAPSVLERQFLAFCFDCWIKDHPSKGMIPRNLSKVLHHVERTDSVVFPHNLLRYVRSHREGLLRDFYGLFGDALDEDSLEKIRLFATGDPQERGSIHARVVGAFVDLAHERQAILQSLKELRRMIQTIRKEPEDPSREERLQNLKKEMQSLEKVVDTIDQKHLYNFLSDEGLLPNYAFPEAGVGLKAIIYRKLRDEPGYEHYVYEYTRPAPSAIRELAPDNSFYSGGRKMVIDQVDVHITKPEAWRLCPRCAHARLHSEVEARAACPRCGTPLWSDTGQMRDMIRLRQVYATSDYERSFSGDESDDREHKFFSEQLFVDVDPDDVVAAYRTRDEQDPFGFDFAQKARLREINFGEKSGYEESLRVAGEEVKAAGFVICRFCGKIQPADSKKKGYLHYFSCPAANQSDSAQFAQSVFLYRQFESEVLRILVPATSLDLDEVVQQSFFAAVMLGLKKHFGSVEHLKATLTSEPVGPGSSEYRKSCLVIYDSVPGGTGYLKHLSRKPEALFDLLQKAVDTMVGCSCARDSSKDGCYRCLYAYQQSRKIPSISRKAAIDILGRIIGQRDSLVQISTLDDIGIEQRFESALERLFVSAWKKKGHQNLPYAIQGDTLQGQEGFSLKVGGRSYFMVQQVRLGKEQGVSIPTRADFVIYPQDREASIRPVVIYTDGFLYHRSRIAEDIAQRMALLRSGGFWVWSLTWKDVQQVFEEQGPFYSDLFDPSLFPFRDRYEQALQAAIQKWGPASIHPTCMDSFALLMHLLADPASVIPQFQRWGFLYAMGVCAPLQRLDRQALVDEARRWVGEEEANPFSHDYIGQYPSKGGRILTRMMMDTEALKAQFSFGINDAQVLSLFDDRPPSSSESPEEESFLKEWNGFLRGCNFFQFLPHPKFLTSLGIEACGFDSWVEGAGIEEEFSWQPPSESTSESEASWDRVMEEICDEEGVRPIALFLRAKGIPVPDRVGFEWIDGQGRIGAEAELAWEERKMVLCRADQTQDAKVFRNQGWKAWIAGEDAPEEVLARMREGG